MSEQTQQLNKDAVIEGFGSEWFSTTAAADGGGFTRHPIGDYRLRVRDFDIKPSQGTSPHNMMAITFETIAVIDGDESAVGQTQTNYYGTPQSPKFMQQRAKQFLDALGVKGAFTPKSLIGRELDGTVTWEKSAPKINEVGEEIVYVNSRLCFERKSGAPKPAKANPRALSAAAMKYLEEKDELTNADDEAADATDATDAAAATPSAPPASEAAPAVKVATPAAESWMPEDKLPVTVHQYRVAIALGKPQAGSARQALVAKRINPAGPINMDHVPEPLRGEYLSWKARQPSDVIPEGLPGLEGLGEGGGGAAAPGNGSPPATPATSKPRTGTRRAPTSA